MGTPARRAVQITGIGLITPLGVELDAQWSALLEGRSGIGPIARFDASHLPSRIAGEVRDFDVTRWLGGLVLRQLDRYGELALAASILAFRHAGIATGSCDPARMGCIVGSGLGGVQTLCDAARALEPASPLRGLSPYLLPAATASLAAGQISILHGLRGPTYTTSAACASGAHAIGLGLRAIQHGDADVVLAGGADAMVNELVVAAFSLMGALSRRNAEPARASRPFSASRDGFVLAEGAAFVVLEDAAHARARGARPIAELRGYGASSDAHHITAMEPSGASIESALRLALADADVSLADVDYLNAHATGTRADAIEAAAIRRVFAARAESGLRVSSTKSMHGHLIGAAGSLELALCALAVERRSAPPGINLEDPDPACSLDLVRDKPHEGRIRAAVSSSFGFGGSNAVLVVAEPG
jgi:3-oxoacyl-[acyl-carrier-protein] synthase II